jgi:hypothetical protein
LQTQILLTQESLPDLRAVATQHNLVPDHLVLLRVEVAAGSQTLQIGHEEINRLTILLVALPKSKSLEHFIRARLEVLIKPLDDVIKLFVSDCECIVQFKPVLADHMQKQAQAALVVIFDSRSLEVDQETLLPSDPRLN